MQPTQRVHILPELPIDHKINAYYTRCHDHDHYEFLFTVRGRALNVINDEVQMLLPRSLLLIRPSDVHFIKALDDGDERFEFYNLPISRSWMEGEFAVCKALYRVATSTKIPIAVTLPSITAAALAAQMEAASAYPPSQVREYLYYGLCRQMCSALISERHDPQEAMRPWFSKLLARVEQIDAGALNYEMLLSLSGVSAKTLWQFFKKHLGITPTEYVRRYRADAAYGMIRETELTLMEIAMKLGYASYAQFYRDFTEFHGLSPRDARKS